MERIDYIAKKVGRVSHDTNFLLDVTERNAKVFNDWSSKTNRRIRKLEKKTAFLGFILLGLVIEDIKIRYKAYQKISNSEKNDPEIEENSEK